jgi:hypothetical protein
MLTAIEFRVRPLYSLDRDRYGPNDHDIVVLCSDGKWRYTDDIYVSRQEALDAILEIKAQWPFDHHDELSYWGVCPANTIPEAA